MGRSHTAAQRSGSGQEHPRKPPPKITQDLLPGEFKRADASFASAHLADVYLAHEYDPHGIVFPRYFKIWNHLETYAIAADWESAAANAIGSMRQLLNSRQFVPLELAGFSYQGALAAVVFRTGNGDIQYEGDNMSVFHHFQRIPPLPDTEVLDLPAAAARLQALLVVYEPRRRRVKLRTYLGARNGARTAICWSNSA